MALVTVAAVMAAAGVVLIVQGMREDPPEAAALPTSTYSVTGTDLDTAVTSARASAQAPSAPEFTTPDTLYIPSLGVAAPIVAESVVGGSLDIPQNPKTVGLARDFAALTSRAGTTLIAGHVTYHGEPGALEHLADTRQGALIVVTDAAGSPTLWAVTALVVRDKADFPVPSKVGPRQLVVVTCGGRATRVDGTWHYTSNVIVTAVPA